MTFLIYSKDTCSFCDKAKQLLEDYDFVYKEKKLENPEYRQELLSRLPSVKTVPQIFRDSEYIGGYTELKQYLEERQ